LEEIGELVWHERTPQSDLALIKERCTDAEIILSNKVPLPREVMESLPKLKLISVLATGYNIVDLEAAKEHGITVCNVSGYSTAMVAQHTVAMILNACSHLDFYPDVVQRGEWGDSPDFFYLPKVPRELSELTIGIIGFGTIGRKVGELLAPFGPRILASQRTPRDAPNWKGFAFASVEEILAESDIVSLHCPQTPETTGLINRESLAQMKSDAWLINTSRGGLIDEAALASALEEGHLSGAWVDVVSSEPMPSANPLRSAPRCFITPHIAWASEPARRRLFDETVENLNAFLKGAPRNVVSG
jgi:glycerate dehydrogenase